MAEYYNISQAKRIYWQKSEISQKWFHYPPKTIKGLLNFMLHHKLYKTNKEKNLYRPKQYFSRNEIIPYYTQDNIKDNLKKGEYLDDETNEIKILSKVTIEWQNNDKTEIFFNDDKSAKDYMEAIIEKYGGNFIKLGND